MVNLIYDAYRILFHVYSEKAFIKQAINGEVIEPLNKNAVIKICYGVVENDIYLEYLISKLCSKRPKLPIRILLKISIFCIKFLNKHPYAITDNAVELCKKLGKSGMSGFLNAILRKYISNPDIKLPSNELEALSIEYSYPLFAVKELVSDYGIEQAKQVMSYDNVVTYLRFAKDVNGEEYLSSLKVDYQNTPFTNCFALSNFTREKGFFEGKYTFQSIGSIAICNIVGKGEKLLDACAAPGGKSVYLAERFSSITACELHPHRVKLIEEYASRMHANNVNAVQADSSVFNPSFELAFDAVLCDVPCSGFGVVKDNPDIKINREYENLNQLNEIQLKILNNAARYVKSGGSLYYSTCSVFKRENDNIIEQFIKQHNDLFTVQQIDSPLTHKKTQFGLQFLPNISSGAGFYVCKLRKL